MKKIFLFTLMAFMVTLWSTLRAQENYKLYIAGIQVTSENAYNVTGNGITGSVSYDANIQTLTLDGVKIDAPNGSNAINNTGIRGLIIKLIGNNTVNAVGSNAGIKLNGNTAIVGNGSLVSVSNDNCGILIEPNTTLSINNKAIVEAKGNYGITGKDGTKNEKLMIEDAIVKAVGKSGSIVDIKDLILDDCTITEPQGAEFNQTTHAVEKDGSKVKTEIIIKKVSVLSKYKLYVAGIQVTSENTHNITGTGITGSVSYDEVNQILTLDNVTINADNKQGILNEGIDNLTIKLINNSKITTNHSGITVKKNTTIEGNGSLMINSDISAIYIRGDKTTLSIKNGCTLDLKGKWGISGRTGKNGEALTVSNSTLKVVGTNGSISDLTALMLIDCVIEKPKGAKFNGETRCVELNGNKVKTEIIIKPDNSSVITYGIKISGTEVTSNNASNITGTGITGSVSYDNVSKVLTLNNASITAPSGENGIWNREVTDLKINLIGNNSINAPTYSGIFLNNNTVINGNGSLTVTANDYIGIFIGSKTELTVKDGCTIKVNGKWGISGSNGTNGEKLIINNATIKSTGSSGSIVDLVDLVLVDCVIQQPKGAIFNNTLHCVELNGEKVKTEVIIIPQKETGLISTHKDKVISVWSNNGMLNIRTNDNVSLQNIQIYSISGQLIHNINTLSSEISISLPSGTYMIKVANTVEKTIVK